MDSFGMLTKSTRVPDTVSVSPSTCTYSLLSTGISSPFCQAPQLAHVLCVFLLFAFIACGKGRSGSWGKEKYQKMIANKENDLSFQRQHLWVCSVTEASGSLWVDVWGASLVILRDQCYLVGQAPGSASVRT